MRRWFQFLFLLLTALAASAHIPREPLRLTPGAHLVRVDALHPSGIFIATTNSWFTNTATPQTLFGTFDAAGNITQRVWKNGAGQTNRTQTLSWDGRGRLLRVIERDAQTNGYNWTAVYDALGRRLRTTTLTVTEGITNYSLPVTISQYFDPSFEFLEVGVSVNGHTTWKLYGPDGSGAYGSMNGTGGYEAIAPPPDLFCPLVSDARGNLHGIYDQRHLDFMWYSNRVTGYGAVPGYRPQPLGFGAGAHDASAWRGRWSDITGLIYLGARYYDPESGRFLSADPLGHGADPSLYAFAGGDPINFFDPDGRLGRNPELAQIENQGFWNMVGLMNSYYAAARESREAQADLWNTRARGLFLLGEGADAYADSAVRVSRYLGWERALEGRAEAAYAAGLANPDTELTFSQRWRYDPTTTFENTLRSAAGWSLMAVPVPFGAAGRVAGMAERAVISDASATFAARSVQAEIWGARQAAAKSGVWQLGATARGTAIENRLAATEYSGWFRAGQLDKGTFPLIDFQKGNNLVSLKTVDTTGSTWLGRMREHIQDLGTRGATVNGNPANMILDIRVQPSGAGAAQQLIGYGQKYGVNVIVKEFP